MPRLRVHQGAVSQRERRRARRGRLVQRATNAFVHWLAQVFAQAFPAPTPPDGSPPPLANAAALREGARLREDVDSLPVQRVAWARQGHSLTPT
jgi:hypothetical protein